MSGKRVMVVDDDRNLAQVLSKRMESLGLDVSTANDGMAAVAMIPRFQPDLIVLDVNMPAGSGLTVCTVLSQDKTLAPIPIIMLTGRSDQDTVRRCEALGAHYLQKSPDVWDRLQPLLCQLLELTDTTAAAYQADAGDRAACAMAPKVLVIDDDPDISKALKIKLKAYGVEVLRAFNGMQGYWVALKERPNAIICDFVMPKGRGNYILGRLKTHALTRGIPVIILTGRTVGGKRDFSLERELLTLGAEKFLTKPLDFDALLKELRKFVDLSANAGALAPV